MLPIPALILAAVGCDADPDNPAEERLAFVDCPKALSGESAGRTCATSSVPLRYEAPAGQKIELLVARYPAEAKSKGQLWLLDGGPGGTGVAYMNENILPIYRQLGYDIYIPQHRGTGHSSALICAEPNSPKSCGAELVEKWADDLEGFNSVEAGHDVGVLIERARSANERVFVLGISYGTYWGQRYLQAYPNQATGVLLDGVLPLDTGLWNGDKVANDAGLRLLTACSEDSACKAALSGDPVAVATRVINRARDATTRCEGSDGFAREALSEIFAGAMVMDIASAIPALLLRLDRCNADDLEQLGVFHEALQEIVNAQSLVDWESVNPALGSHVLRTDLMAELDSQPLDDLRIERDKLIVYNGAISLEATDQLTSEWPVNYPPIDKTVSAAKVPLLISNGGFDVQTPLPWASNLAEANGINAMIFPFAGHAVDISLAGLTQNLTPCSIQIKSQFLDNPSGRIDSSCIAELPAPDFSAQTETGKAVSKALFGTEEYLPGFVNSTEAQSTIGTQSAGVGFSARRLLVERLRQHPSIVANLRRRLSAKPSF